MRTGHMQQGAVRRVFGLFFLAAAAVMPGCQTEVSEPRKPIATPAAAQAGLCASNMHELSGVLLQYYLVHQRLPETIPELAAIAGDEAVKCPVTGTPYLYFPEGLRAPDQPRWLVLVDGDRPAAGHRSAIVISEPQGNQPLGMWVIELSDEQLGRYLRK